MRGECLCCEDEVLKDTRGKQRSRGSVPLYLWDNPLERAVDFADFRYLWLAWFPYQAVTDLPKYSFRLSTVNVRIAAGEIAQ